MVNAPLSDKVNQIMPLRGLDLYKENLRFYILLICQHNTCKVLMNQNSCYTFINSHSQVRDPGPEDPLVKIGVVGQ